MDTVINRLSVLGRQLQAQPEEVPSPIAAEPTAARRMASVFDGVPQASCEKIEPGG